jgi:hypothetical protein
MRPVTHGDLHSMIPRCLVSPRLRRCHPAIYFKMLGIRISRLELYRSAVGFKTVLKLLSCRWPATHGNHRQSRELAYPIAYSL